MQFWFRLAGHLGRTVEELQHSISSQEFTEWMAFSRFEPFGCEIENFRAGTIAATVANVAPRKKGAKPFKSSDFYPRASRPEDASALRRALAEKRARALAGKRAKSKLNEGR